MQTLPLGKLVKWDKNPRARLDAEELDSLKASIRDKGVLQNLVVVPNQDGTYTVIAGDRRFTALTALAEAGEIGLDYPVPVQIRDIDLDDPEAIETALAENVIRSKMDEIDECIAMAELVRKGRTIEAIAAKFGYKKRVVKERLALGRLIPEAQDLIRRNERDLDWARAMTLADTTTQHKFCEDIKVNPGAWKDGNEIRRYLTSDTIPAEHALFDRSAYKGRIIYDMFEGDRLADRAEFWELQNKAIDELKKTLAGEGFAAVEVSHNPIDVWRYRQAASPAEGKAIIEVSPNGKVTVHRGLVEAETAASAAEASHEIEVIEEEQPAELAGDAVRLNPGLLEYAAAHRSAMIQAAVGRTPRKALEIVVAGLIGHSEIPIRAQDYRFPGSIDIRTGAAFETVAALRDEIDRAFEKAGVPASGRKDQDVMAMLAAMDEDELMSLLTRLVALKIGAAGKRLDGNAGSLVNSLGTELAIDVRASWTPDEHFFSLMQTPDLRRLAHELLPGDRQMGVLTAKKPHLVKMLADAFADARENDGSMDAADAARLNAWVPGVMRFPAEDDAARPAIPEAADAMPFGENDDADHETAFEAIFAGETKATA